MTTSILVVSPSVTDPDTIRSALAQQESVRIVVVSSYGEAVIALARDSFAVILCDACFSHTCWKDLLGQIAFLSNPPPLILMSVVSRVPLWAEAMRLGVRDVLAKPLDPVEVRRVVSRALSPMHTQGLAAERESALPEWAVR
jgi:DNA-binding NtrC family response regulator